MALDIILKSGSSFNIAFSVSLDIILKNGSSFNINLVSSTGVTGSIAEVQQAQTEQLSSSLANMIIVAEEQKNQTEQLSASLATSVSISEEQRVQTSDLEAGLSNTVVIEELQKSQTEQGSASLANTITIDEQQVSQIEQGSAIVGTFLEATIASSSGLQEQVIVAEQSVVVVSEEGGWLLKNKQKIERLFIKKPEKPVAKPEPIFGYIWQEQEASAVNANSKLSCGCSIEQVQKDQELIGILGLAVSCEIASSNIANTALGSLKKVTFEDEVFAIIMAMEKISIGDIR